jgi:mono/diheme cytochrome c family protein
MKKITKIFLIIISIIFILIAGGVSFLKFRFPDVGAAPDLKLNADSALLARGSYLANHVAVCIDCHSARDWNYLSGPIVHGTEGQGGEIFSEKFGFPGTFYAKNITPEGIGNWTDGEIYRAITSGVSKNGEPFFPIMPYPNYNTMDTEDVHAIIAYIRTLAPIKNKVEPSSANFPVNLILRTMPKPANPQKRPEKSQVLEYGSYLFKVAACNNCHTPHEKGEPIEGKFLAGGFEFPLAGGIVRSANLTQDKETGIGHWTKETFISKFKAFKDSSMSKSPVSQGAYNTIMPWTMYAGMTDEDLSAIFEYLQTVPAIKNEVIKYTANKE